MQANQQDQHNKTTKRNHDVQSPSNQVYERADDHDIDIDTIQIECGIDINNEDEVENVENSDCFYMEDMDEIIKGLEFPQDIEYINSMDDMDNNNTWSDDIKCESEKKDEFNYEYPTSQQLAAPLPLVAPPSIQNTQTMLNTLQNMPWKDLPLNEFIFKFKNDKWVQAQIIYNKYLDKKSEIGLNIAHSSRTAVKNAYTECMRYYQIQNGQGYNYDHTSDTTEELDINTNVLKIFDSLIPDLFDNLDNVASRFNAI